MDGIWFGESDPFGAFRIRRQPSGTSVCSIYSMCMPCFWYHQVSMLAFLALTGLMHVKASVWTHAQKSIAITSLVPCGPYMCLCAHHLVTYIKCVHPTDVQYIWGDMPVPYKAFIHDESFTYANHSLSHDQSLYFRLWAKEQVNCTQNLWIEGW